MPIDRCVCHNRTFEEILKISRKEGFMSLEELQEAEICCNQCTLCKPYIKLMLKNGQTRFSYDTDFSKLNRA